MRRHLLGEQPQAVFGVGVGHGAQAEVDDDAADADIVYLFKALADRFRRAEDQSVIDRVPGRAGDGLGFGGKLSSLLIRYRLPEI